MIRLKDVPECLFCKVGLVNDLYNVMILNRVKRHIEGSSNDVRVKSALGGEEMISRKDLLKNYRQISGKKLKMILLKEEKALWVKGSRNYMLYALKVPSQGLRCKDGMVEPGKWVVCRADEEGHVDSAWFIALDDKYFRKMFRIHEIPFREELVERNRRIDNGEAVGQPIPAGTLEINDAISEGYSGKSEASGGASNMPNENSIRAKHEDRMQWKVIAKKKTANGMLYRIESENGDRQEITQEILSNMMENGSISYKA